MAKNAREVTRIVQELQERLTTDLDGVVAAVKKLIRERDALGV